MASQAGTFLTGRLRIEHRTSKKDGQTRKFIVPVIDLDVTTRALMSGEVSVPSLGTGGGTVDGGSHTSASLPSGQVAELPSGSGDIAGESVAPVASDKPRLVTQAQIGRMMAVAKEHDVSVEDLKLVVRDVAGVSSRKDIPADRYDAVIAAISGELAPDTDRAEDIG